MFNVNHASNNILGEALHSTNNNNNNERSRRNVYLDGAQSYYTSSSPNTVKVAPAPTHFHQHTIKAFEPKVPPNGVVYDTIKPMLLLLRAVGIYPIGNTNQRTFKVTIQWMGYSVVIFLVLVLYVGYIKWDRIELVRSAEGRFEEAVIDYLFTVYLLPIVINPIVWYEARKLAKVASDWASFEEIYTKVAHRKLPLFLGNKPLIITIAMPLLACGTMIVTHVTMAHFRVLQVNLCF